MILCGTDEKVQETKKLTACLYVQDSSSQSLLESRYIECSCVVADLYYSSRLSCVVAAPQDCVEVVQALWLLNLLSNCSLISQLARLVVLQCMHLHVYSSKQYAMYW